MKTSFELNWADVIFIGGTLLFLFLVFIFFVKILNPFLFLRKEKSNKAKKEENLKQFYQIFGFEFKVEEIEKEKVVYGKVQKLFEDFIRESLCVDKITKILSFEDAENEKIFRVFKDRNDILQDVNYGLGFKNTEYLKMFIDLKLGFRKNLLEEAYNLSKFFYPNLPLNHVERYLKGIQIN